MWIEDGESWPGVVVPMKVGSDLPKQSLRIHKVRAPKPESRLFFFVSYSIITNQASHIQYNDFP